MKKTLLKSLLIVARALGLFALARRLTARDLRILCYHGAALDDESRFRPGLFMTADTFAARMRFLADRDYPVMPLADALQGLRDRDLPPGATVITIDDGWYGTYRVMVPVLREHGFAATLYVASYYLVKQTQVLNVAADYVLWRAGQRELDLARVADGLTGAFDLGSVAARAAALRAVLDYATTLGDAGARQDLFRSLCRALDVDWAAIENDRLISFMTADEARAALADGIDLQLHTHRHRFPASRIEDARAEIDDNRAVLRELTDRELCHFCYPSGEYTADQLPWLERLGIRSATTTRAGFNRPGASAVELTRFLDSEHVSPLEFEAEMSGFFELIRRCGYAI